MQQQCTEENGSCVVRLSGRFTFVDHGSFKEVIKTLTQSDCTTGKLDMFNLDFIDSAGLGMLLILKDEMKRIDKEVILLNPSPQVLKMLKVSQFGTLFKIETPDA